MQRSGRPGDVHGPQVWAGCARVTDHCRLPAGDIAAEPRVPREAGCWPPADRRRHRRGRRRRVVAGSLNNNPGATASHDETLVAERGMNIRDGFIEMVGNTPLIKLQRPSEETGCTILGKAEFLNPGGSVKDRAALFIIKDAEERGLLRPGGVIVEGTAGNTGIGLALVGNARGYRTVIVMPETQSQEKKDMLRLCGADLRLVAAVPYANPMNYVRYSERLAAEIAAVEPNGAIWANQFDNVANRRAHYETTGPEIWAETQVRSTRLSARSALAARCPGSASHSGSASATSRSISPTRWDRASTAG